MRLTLYASMAKVSNSAEVWNVRIHLHLALAISAGFLSACVGGQTSRSTPVRMSPTQAVINAAEMPGGVGGVFEMVVRASGRANGLLFLNSETDYRYPRNLTIVIAPFEERALAGRRATDFFNSLLRLRSERDLSVSGERPSP